MYDKANVVVAGLLLAAVAWIVGPGCATTPGAGGLPVIDVKVVDGQKYDVAGEVVELSRLAARLVRLGCGAETEIRIELPKQAAPSMFRATIAELRRRGFTTAVFVKPRKIDVIVSPSSQ